MFLLSDGRPMFSPSSDMCQVFVHANNHSDEKHTVHDHIYVCHQFMVTVISVLQGTSGYMMPHPTPKSGSKAVVVF